MLLAAVAVGLGVWVFRLRRREGGVDGRKPVAALLCGGLNLFCGGGLVVAGLGLGLQAGGTPWVWRSDRHGFELTVPTERWAVQPNPNVEAQFSVRWPPMAGLVAEARPAATDAEWEAVLAEVSRRAKAETPMAAPDERTGTNPHGRPYWLYMGEARAGDKPYFFGVSVTRAGGRAVVLMVEGEQRMASRVGREREGRALRDQAELFLTSVR